MLGIPVVAILDSNVSPDGIAFPVPANDDASRAIRLYCDAVSQAATKGHREGVVDSGADIGAMAEPLPEEVAVVVSAETPAEAPVVAEAPAAAEAVEAPEAVVAEEAAAPEAVAEEAPAAEPTEEEIATEA